MNIPKGIYKHFKGHVYKVIGIAKHSETLEEQVVYVSISDSTDIWVRPANMFLDMVERDGKQFQRFEF
ncbi:MAG: DUF1653 domain-containing protein, partial [Methyloprofundus sp.]|nr:DUF1653 domain-containing protein [Methyloprofundus sp.]